MTVAGYNEELGGTAISRNIWTWARLAGGAAILAVLVWRVGASPFVDGLRLTTAWALAAAVAITSLTTLCCAWRWSLVARPDLASMYLCGRRSVPTTGPSCSTPRFLAGFWATCSGV